VLPPLGQGFHQKAILPAELAIQLYNIGSLFPDFALSLCAGSFLLGSNGSRSEKIRGRSDSPFSITHQKRSVKQRLYLSIDSDSE